MTQLAGGIAQGVIAEEIPFFSRFLVKKTLITAGVCPNSPLTPFLKFIYYLYSSGMVVAPCVM